MRVKPLMLPATERYNYARSYPRFFVPDLEKGHVELIRYAAIIACATSAFHQAQQVSVLTQGNAFWLAVASAGLTEQWTDFLTNAISQQADLYDAILSLHTTVDESLNTDEVVEKAGGKIGVGYLVSGVALSVKSMLGFRLNGQFVWQSFSIAVPDSDIQRNVRFGEEYPHIIEEARTGFYLYNDLSPSVLSGLPYSVNQITNRLSGVCDCAIEVQEWK